MPKVNDSLLFVNLLRTHIKDQLGEPFVEIKHLGRDLLGVLLHHNWEQIREVEDALGHFLGAIVLSEKVESFEGNKIHGLGVEEFVDGTFMHDVGERVYLVTAFWLHLNFVGRYLCGFFAENYLFNQEISDFNAILKFVIV